MRTVDDAGSCRRSATEDEIEVWLAAQSEPASPRYHVPVAFRTAAPVAPERVRRAVRRVQAGHERLRSRFVTDGGTLVREVVGDLDDVPTPVTFEHRPGDFDLADALPWLTAAAAGLFDLADAPLFRVNIRCYRDSTLVVVTMHHLVCDAWSTDVLLDQLLTAIRGEADGDEETGEGAGAPLAVDEDSAVEYWTTLLEDQPASMVPIADRAAGLTAGPPAFVRRMLDPALLAGLRGDPELAPSSPAVILLSVWTSLLHLWSGQSDGLSGLTFSGRLDDSVHEDVRLMARVLPVRTRVDPHEPIADVVTRTRRQVQVSLAHSEVSAGTVRRLLRAGQSGAGQLGAAFTYTLTNPDGLRREHGVEVIDVPLAAGKNTVGLSVSEAGAEVLVQLDYDTERYAAATAELLTDQFVLAVRRLAERRRGSRFAVRDLLVAHEPDQAGRPTTAADARWESGVESPVELVRRASAADPDHLAAVHGEASITYGELMRRVDAVAHALRAAGVVDGELVATLLPRGIPAIVTLLGIVAAGGAYLPMDPEYPASQLRAIVDDSGVRRVIVDAPRDTGLPEGVAVLTVAELERAGAAVAGPAHYPHPAGDRALFHCIYTSGSTGRPKGVLLDRRGFLRLLRHDDFVPVGPLDVLAHLSPLNFDASTFELWAGVTQGATLVVLDKADLLDPDAMADAFRRTGITVAILTNPLFNHLVDRDPAALRRLRWFYIGGEAVSPDHVRAALPWVTPGGIVHSYGPAENSFTTHCRPIRDVPAQARTIALGREVPHTQAYVVYENTLVRTPQGVPGELLVGGPGLAWGYLGDPRRTAAKFVPDPFGDLPAARLYRTGDRVRWDTAGEVEFIERLDNQVKIRGNRVELSGVESTLRAAPGIVSACVIYPADAGGGKELLAFVVPEVPGRLDAARAYLESQLPAFAQPRRWIEVDRLPRKQNNKIDQQALVGLARARRAATTQAPAPVVRTAARGADDVHAEVHAAWVAVLGHDDVAGRNFFDAGGDSLLLFALSEAILTRLGRTVPVAEILRYPTIEAQADRLREGPAGPSRGAVTVAPAAASATDIAIVGMACRVPGARDVTEFWDLLRSGRTAIEGPETDFIRPLGGDRRFVQRWGGVAGGVYHYDPAGFGLRPEEAETLDPQHGLFLECVRSAVEDAGYDVAEIAPATALVAGAARRVRPVEPNAGFSAGLADSGAYLATRAAYQFGFLGEAMMIDTACSTSLVAVHLACESLRAGNARFALAGGVSVQEPPDGGYVHEPGLIYSPTGVCRPHDRRADGAVGGDGVGLVLLRPLADALAAGDSVYAVIRGSAVNNDGSGKVGYTAPGHDGQVAVIRRALAAARVSGADIGYVETHGTGTRLGDAVEATALSTALSTAPAAGPTVAIGAVKATIGHLNTAAGVVGLIKSALSVWHRTLPATPNVGDPIEELAAGPRPLRLLDAATGWPGTGPVLAGVSSFGIGGTNAHLVLGAA
ncbi:amino acid adenylation domain-containing protein [Actinophytocola sp.]|uniref:amino acid adenylation domain-containing protein n=1 Tax=Actinophytocola sp. TaxID=1872138 RepID=UPI002ED94607